MCTKWPLTPLYCPKNSLRGLGEKAFHCKGGDGEKFRVAKQMKFRNFAQVPDLISESLGGSVAGRSPAAANPRVKVPERVR